ncbi:uncharacterized protein LOC127874823 isoform X2 [Dreissena polymorpha]|uniref:uncharacterized protein LOC127874823 isoform X2 n=1 Tax=Dreissena polymorpha TaxID=45954 RepID=UPI002264C911|nr:uncharacterized protein LOC127874823 isoform X2 [Dreissena polymorpha]
MMLDERSLVLTALLITLSMEVKCQQLYSSGVQWMPTGNGNELQIYSHLSWQQFNIGTCILPACLTAYKLTNKSALTFGRLSGYKWTCAKGCSTSLTVSGFDGVYFTEVKNYTGAMWEAGDETKAFNFGATVTSEIELELSFQNGSTPYQTMLSERAMLTLATRNDTNRTNMSPSLVVFPMYSVPLGCSITINLHPYDGDGDFVTCRLTHPLPGCKLNQDSCTLTMSATGANGYVVDGIYSGEVIAEDYNEEKVTLSKGGNSVISKGPFSRVPIMISVHVTASPVSSTCLDSPRLKPVSEPVISIQPLDVMSRVIESYTASTVFLTVGRQGSTFDKMTPSGVNVTLTSTDVGVYRTCAMGYNQEGHRRLREKSVHEQTRRHMP